MADEENERRRFLRLLLATPIAFALGSRVLHAGEPGYQGLLAAAAEGRLPPTPDCGDDDEPTPSETQGPFFTPNSPERGSLLERGMAGTRIELTGRVFGRDCRPMAGALLDFWHADHEGNYDNEGYRLRGHQHADAEGRYRLLTIVLGLYPGRTRHFHVRVQPRRGRVLTTQLYFPGEPRNRRDGLYRPDLSMTIDAHGSPRRALFHFVLDAG